MIKMFLVVFIVGAMSSEAQVSGTFTINNNQPTSTSNFHSFTEAAAYVSNGVNGPVVFNVAAGTVYNERISFMNIIGTSAINFITINGNEASINSFSENTNDRACIKISGTDYVTINNLKFNPPAQFNKDFCYAIQLVDDADHNVITNCSFTYPLGLTSSNYAALVINSSTSANLLTTGKSLCDSNIISNNQIIGGYAGIVLLGKSDTSLISGNKLLNNTIKDIYEYGIYLNGNNKTIVQGNDISRSSRTSISGFTGIYLGMGNLNISVNANKIHNAFDAYGDFGNPSYGVYLDNCIADANNANLLTNNLIYEFKNGGSQFGIYNKNSTSLRIYFNTISLENQFYSPVYKPVTRGYHQENPGVGIELKNNIININRPSPESQCIYLKTTSAGIISDYNNLITVETNAGNNLGFSAGAQYKRLDVWKSSGNDAHSISIAPQFVSATNLHLQQSSEMSDKGLPIAGVVTDIDGENRSPARTYIGADEIPLSASADIKAVGLVSPTVSKGCYNIETTIIKIKNNSINTIDFANDPVQITVSVSGPGITNLNKNISSGILLSGETLDVAIPDSVNMTNTGTYTFRIISTTVNDLNHLNDTAQAIRNKELLSIGIVNSYPTAFCREGGIASLSVSSYTGSTLQWQQSDSNTDSGFANISGANSATFTLSTPIFKTRYYRLIAGCGNTSVTSLVYKLTVDSAIIRSTTPASRCGPGMLTLTATSDSGNIINWYSSPTSSTILATGPTFTTPILDSSKTYYVSSESATAIELSSLPSNPAAVGPIGDYTDNGLHFSLAYPILLHSLDRYQISPGSKYPDHMTMSRVGGPNFNFEFPSQTFIIGIPNTQYREVHLPAGDYTMTYSNFSMLQCNSAGASYPYITGPLAITGNTTPSQSYGYYYNWKFSTNCQSNRIPVTATINTPGGWLGAHSTAWENPLNWSCNIVPDATTKVVIPDGANVLITSNVVIYSLKISPNAKLTVQTGFTLSVLH